MSETPGLIPRITKTETGNNNEKKGCENGSLKQRVMTWQMCDP
jgi:hypothetical protein